jgi:hypothetical protein
MRCEYCTKKLGSRELAHGIRYGAIDRSMNAFIPDRDSAPTVICQSCGELLLNLIYVKLNKQTQPSLPNYYR